MTPLDTILFTPRPDWFNGTVARYNTGCRCPDCTGAAATYRTAYRNKRGVA